MDGNERARAKRERILAVSRTLHSIPAEEGGMLKRKVQPAAPPAGRTRGWKGRALATGGAAALLAMLVGAWRRRDR